MQEHQSDGERAHLLHKMLTGNPTRCLLGKHPWFASSQQLPRRAGPASIATAYRNFRNGLSGFALSHNF
jgi:hypothetical protein